MRKHLREILERLPHLRLAVIGDCMLDRFLWGRVDRISPEAPVPVVRLEGETRKLGGAANVANNVRALGARVALFGVAGEDEAGGDLVRLLAEREIGTEGLLRVAGRPTTLKTRIIAHNQQVVRADSESDEPLSALQGAELLGRLDALGPFAGIIVSDYGKGVLSDDLLARVIELGRGSGAVVTVDPKNGDFRQYRGATSLTPNQKEAGAACSLAIVDEASLLRAGWMLLERTAADAVLITRGEQGMALFERGGIVHQLRTEATEVFDVTGAGDTVIAVYTAALAAGAGHAAAASLANHAAGLAVRELGTVAISGADLAAALEP